MTGRRGGAGEREDGHRPRSEADFVIEIDCQFPYVDRERALALTSEACSISANAAFGVVYEICNVPRGVAADPETRDAVLRRIETLLSHPLAKVILPLARALVEGEHPTSSEQIDAMRKVAAFPGQYYALQVALYAGNPEDPGDEDLDRVYDEILAEWERRDR
ncbi:MAG TPA: hypothetical protein VFY93_15555 [Planctomycetota bacterium]|nr:hypothetical protein [Planctomycetota bacterium]